MAENKPLSIVESNCNKPKKHRNRKPRNKNKQKISEEGLQGSQAHSANSQNRNFYNGHPLQKNKLPRYGFEEYISKKECSDGLKRKELIQGVIRVNQKNFTESFINGDYGERDILLDGVLARNRALPGDIVAVQLLPKEHWKGFKCDNDTAIVKNEIDEIVQKNDCLVKRGKVVYIIENKHPKIATGHLSPYRGNQFEFALMSPIDNRLPRLMIPLEECPSDFKTRPHDFGKTLFVAKIKEWERDLGFAHGALMRTLGEAGHIVPETESILANNAIDSSPFTEKVIACLPDGKTWSIPPEEIAKRKDLRSECIFTIDPATARDLDDALSCKKIGDDLYEVGVHIADVSHFIDQGTALDDVAASRATSVYLTQNVIPMLPSILCEQLCSLNPNVERLAYSVVWNMSSDGKVFSEWFGKSVICSCAKLSYNHAQQLIETETLSPVDPVQYPDVSNGFALNQIRDKIHILYSISQNLRKRRFDFGALRLDQPKLCFNLDSETGLPNGFSVYEYKDSNRLVEEFMLLANMAVGRKIYMANPDRAILRNHPPPHQIMIEEVSVLCQKHNIPFDISDSKSISDSLNNLSKLDPEVKAYLEPALVLLCTKPFQNATYFCTGTLDDEAAYRHYALNVPIYTHFTSPIRRYPDILVHRFLTAALNPNFSVCGTAKQLQIIADHCNDKKWAAKKASEQSSDLFFAVYLQECGPLEEKGVIMGVFDKAVDVLCTRLGTSKRVYCDKLSLHNHHFENNEANPKLTLIWKEEADNKGQFKTIDEKLNSLKEKFEGRWALQKQNENDSTTQNDILPPDCIKQVLSIFTPVNVILSVDPKAPTRVNIVLKNPRLNT